MITLPRFLLLAMFGLVPALATAQITPAAGAAAGDDTQPPSARVGAVIFYDYTKAYNPKVADLAGNMVAPSAFSTIRTYINVTGNISHVVSYRITPDISRLSLANNGLNGSMVFRLKYGYAQFALTDWTKQWTASYVRLGLQQTPIIDYEEAVYRYRFQGTLFAERDGGMSSSDAGASFHANIPNSYGDFHVGYYNGEGYTSADPNDQKAVMLRGTLRPMPTGSALARGLRLTAFYFGDHYQKAYDRNRFMFNALLEQRHYNFGFDYMNRGDQNKTPPDTTKVESDGYSFFVTPFFKEKGNGFEMLIRYDSFRPDIEAVSNRRQNRSIIGLAYWFPHPGGAGTAALMLDYEGIRYSNFPAAQTKQDKLILHGLINF